MADPVRNPAAPVDEAALALSLRPFGSSVMLPPAAYTDPAVFGWEQQHLLGGGWTCVGFSAHLPEPGTEQAWRLGAAHVRLARDGDGAVKAFTGERELPAAEWHGLIFVDGSNQAEPLPAVLATIEDLVAPYEPERLVTAARRDYDVASNWKTLAENYHECYHCPSIHPEFCVVSPPSSGGNYPAYGSWLGGYLQLEHGAETMALDGVSLGVPLRGLDGAALRTVSYLNVFPNVLLSLHPDYVMTHLLVPLAADRTLIECYWAFPPEALARPGFDPGYAVGIWDITNLQDWRACESVQRGLSGGHAAPGPLVPDEAGVYQFVTMVARGYLGQPVANQPLPHLLAD
jgi:Rieske 2Fe-2S family protein